MFWIITPHDDSCFFDYLSEKARVAFLRKACSSFPAIAPDLFPASGRKKLPDVWREEKPCFYLPNIQKNLVIARSAATRQSTGGIAVYNGIALLTARRAAGIAGPSAFS